MSNGSVPQTKVAVYCGASPGNDPRHLAMARELAHAMAKRNIALVYGGGTIGIMGEVARTLVSLSGPSSVHGIIPEPLVRYERDLSKTNGAPDAKIPSLPAEQVFGRTTVVPDMHTRKKLMAQEVFEGGPGSGFIALSGGYGTMEEIFETATWNQLGIHNKGMCLLNVDGFYDGIVEWIRKSSESGFISGANKDILATAEDAEGALNALLGYKVSVDTLKLEWGTL
ncbi:related to Rossmann fold nucleotide-binding protein [Cephalotrichum gorgonifer]|uniref:Related to Rossmann fold nucleotide-binding protein n=1 Tax=Cephalotrichum gorgonifer TaxID=2041049 RepID=A0AAE8MUE9_9PEZI|nr:related to Rossmann fold nucleotide-binding protein [Cephalotrichum gorgonifer]